MPTSHYLFVYLGLHKTPYQGVLSCDKILLQREENLFVLGSCIQLAEQTVRCYNDICKVANTPLHACFLGFVEIYNRGREPHTTKEVRKKVIE